ncbi:MAG TPA: cysteine synthase A [Armatimonadetes bacterium]|nr:cysteine synthase A [Armatimonadota bacterium]
MALLNPGVLRTIGNTPLVPLLKVVPAGAAAVWVKLEARNPGGSVKDRIGHAMLSAACEQGLFTWGQTTIVEPTSGNTGIGLALAAAVGGNRVILTMPESMSIERRRLLAALGAQIELTPAAQGMGGAIERARGLLAELEDAYMPNQFENPANPAAHEATTGPEIWAQTEGRLDAFVAGVGTGGTITGVGRYLRARQPDVRLIAVEPAGSPVLSGGERGSHGIQGIGAGFCPRVLEFSLLDRVLTVTDAQAIAMARRLAAEEGIFCGISSGAAAHAAVEVAGEMGEGGTVVTVLPDTGERYLSTALFETL